MEPTFKEIWTSEFNTFAYRRDVIGIPAKSKTYYRIRSIVRTVSFVSVFIVANQLLGWIDSW